MSGELQQAGTLLPAWVGWCPIAVYVALAALLSLIACGTAARLAGRPLRRLASGHWTERARLAWPIRVTTSVAALAVPALTAVGAVLTVGPLARWSPLEITCACCAVSVASAMVVRFWSERQLRPSAVTGPIWLAGAAALTLIRLPHLVLFLVTTIVMLTLPPLWTTSTVLVAVLSGLGFLGCALGGGTWLARRIGLIRPAGPRLAAIVRDHAERMGAPVAGVFEVRDPEAAIALYAMAAEAPGADHRPATSVAILLAAFDRCDEAEDWILDAQSRFGPRSTGGLPTVEDAWRAVSICRQRRGEQPDEDVIPDEL